MKRFIGVLFIALFILCITPLNVYANNVPQEVLDASKSVVYIEVESATMISSGSGFVITNSTDGTYIITNNHVVNLNVKGIAVWISESEKRSATLIASSEQYDLAIIRITEPIDTKALILSSQAKQGDEVFAVGFPEAANYLSNSDARLSDEVTITNGIISSVRTTRNIDHGPEIELLQINADLNPGNSGGPLFNKNGEVIGINTYGVIDSQGIFGAISTSELMKFLEENNFSIDSTISIFSFWIFYIVFGLVAIVVIICTIRFIPFHKKLKNSKGITELKLTEYLSLLNKPITPNEAVSLLMPIVLHLREKHNQGTVYLKLSPSRIIVTTDGCHFYESDEMASDEFYSPEQRSGDFAGIKADIFGICALLRFMLQYYYRNYGKDENPQNSSLEVINAIINKGLSENPEDRYANMQELILNLAPFNTGISAAMLTPFSQEEGFLNSDTYLIIQNKKQKPKKKRLALILIFSGLGFALIILFVFFTVSYFSAINHAENYEFSVANKEFNNIPFVSKIFPQDSCFIIAGLAMENREYDKATEKLNTIENYKGASELLSEVKYRKAAQLANQNTYDQAIDIYKQLSSYKDSDKLINDTVFRKACYLIETSNFDESLELLRNLSEDNYPEAKEKISELYYVWGNSLLSGEEYLKAYDKLVLAGDYLDSKQIILELTDYIYNAAIDFYHKAQYDKATRWFAKTEGYLVTDSFLTLIKAHNKELNIYDELYSLIGFEDANELIMSNHVFVQKFLLGTWRGDSRYFKMKENGQISYDIPWIKYGDYYRIENGIILIFKESTPNTTKNLYRVTIINENCIQIFAYKNSRTYTLYRQ